MGTWGTALYSDDLAADLRAGLRERIGAGLTVSAAVDELLAEYASSLADPEEEPVLWLALAETAWRLGRPEERATANALRVIENGTDLARWTDPAGRKKRAAVLTRLRATLLSAPPEARRVPRPFRAANDWAVGELIAFRLASGRHALLRVIGHHEDRGGRNAVCELLDWLGESVPEPGRIGTPGIRRARTRGHASQFLLAEPRTAKDRARLVRLGTTSRPAQEPAGFLVFVFPHVDRQLREVFGVE